VTLSYLPTILLAIIFGLSSDYEVFVVSRIKEHFTKTGDAREAVRRGASASVRVVAAAAVIMFSIFVAFTTTNNVDIRPIAFSFAVGVLVDAFVVRLTLVPAIMAITGPKIWYHPKWFTKYVPDPDIEGLRLKRPTRGGRSGALGADEPLTPSRTRRKARLAPVKARSHVTGSPTQAQVASWLARHHLRRNRTARIRVVAQAARLAGGRT
jgi:RND superfamily putative drug exporter